LSAVQEQRRSRHWSILFKTLGFLYLFIVLFLAAGWFRSDGVSLPKAHTALVDLQGVISADKISADSVISSLQGAFEDKKTQGVILRINSPGGSPVQAGQIYDEIKRLRAKHPKVPLYAVVDDICASGGYYVAAGADKIFVDKASIVGSIGVLMDGFGFTETMQKIGVERRLLTAGENKGFLDPFSPVDPKQQAFAKQMLEEIHAQFIAVVREGRGKRLKETPETFSGLVWSGEKSIQLGLADAFGTVESVARDVIKAEDIVDFTRQDSLFERLAGRLGATMAKAWSPFDKAGVSLR
ncbi:MAG: S49 family peptidase, partial [Thiobacillus sp.]|nr:S49 family peptidase [Thiobacillus sp.]